MNCFGIKFNPRVNLTVRLLVLEWSHVQNFKFEVLSSNLGRNMFLAINLKNIHVSGAACAMQASQRTYGT